MKKNDLVLLSFLAIIFVTIYFFMNFSSATQESRYEVRIRDCEGRIIVKEITEDGEFEIQSKDKKFYNKYEIKNGVVSMIDSNCRDKLCVKMKKISKNGEMIVCLPHKVYISVHDKNKKNDGDSLDAVSE